ncbi:MAG: PIN domain-containing protein [Pirellulales bacterium]
MDQALLDTDMFSEVLKAKNANVVRNAMAYRQRYGRYTVSAVTVTEMVKGFHKRGREDRIQGLVAGLATEEVLDLDLSSAIIAGRIYGELEKVGQPIGRADPLIAGIALARNLALVTGNTRHFERVVSLGFPLLLADWRT